MGTREAEESGQIDERAAVLLTVLDQGDTKDGEEQGVERFEAVRLEDAA